MSGSFEAFPDTQIIDSDVRWHDWRHNLSQIIRYRYLLLNLVRRDLKVRYRNSFLGVLWSLLNPLLMMLVFSLIFAKLIPRGDIRQYPVFFLVGLLPWNFFSGSLISGTTSITASASLIKKVYFPRELLPASAIFSSLINFFLAFIVLIIFLYASGLGLTLNALWVIPILITQVIFILGLVFLLSALHVFYRDIIMILDVVVLAWFFMTPVIYSLDWLGNARTLFGITFTPAVFMRWLNPMASIIDGYRTVLWGTMGSNGPANMDTVYLLRTLLTSVIVFAIGFTVFSRTQHLFGEKL